MKPITPTQSIFKTPGGPLRVQQSTFKMANGGIADASPVGTDATGVYNKFQQDNGNGVMLRIGSSSSSEPIHWVTSNVGVAINHGLQRQPIGWYVADKDKTCDIYRTAVPNSNTITLACTDATANCTVYIF